jgi:hypothetical protein
MASRQQAPPFAHNTNIIQAPDLFWLGFDRDILKEEHFASIARQLLPDASFCRRSLEEMKSAIGVKRILSNRVEEIPLFMLVLAFEQCGYTVLAQNTLAKCVG